MSKKGEEKRRRAWARAQRILRRCLGKGYRPRKWKPHRKHKEKV